MFQTEISDLAELARLIANSEGPVCVVIALNGTRLYLMLCTKS